MGVYITNDTDLKSVADAIREKAGITDKLVYPDGFISAIPDGIPKGLKIKYIIPATYLPKRTSDDFGFDITTFTFTRENVNQLMFVDWSLQDETDFLAGFWTSDIIWALNYQGNSQNYHYCRVVWIGGGKAGNHVNNKSDVMAKTALTKSHSYGNNTTTDDNYKRKGTTYKGLIFIYDSSYDGAPIVDETKLTQYFTNCNGQLTAGW